MYLEDILHKKNPKVFSFESPLTKSGSLGPNLTFPRFNIPSWNKSFDKEGQATNVSLNFTTQHSGSQSFPHDFLFLSTNWKRQPPIQMTVLEWVFFSLCSFKKPRNRWFSFYNVFFLKGWCSGGGGLTAKENYSSIFHKVQMVLAMRGGWLCMWQDASQKWKPSLYANLCCVHTHPYTQ
jgi:hypothetical protein